MGAILNLKFLSAFKQGKILILVLVGVFFFSLEKPALAFLPKPTPTYQPTPTPTPAKVDYFLAYPGILPDHFLYPIKMIRDRIRLFLTNEPIKKTELLLLYADKRLGAGKILIEGGKEKMGLTTITKAEKYLERAVGYIEEIRKAGKENEGLKEKLMKAAKKHEEVLMELAEKSGEETKGALEKILEYPRRLYQEIKGK